MGVAEWLRVESGCEQVALTLVLTQGHPHATGDIRSGTWEPPRAGSGQNEGPWDRGKKYDSVYLEQPQSSLCETWRNLIGLDKALQLHGLTLAGMKFESLGMRVPMPMIMSSSCACPLFVHTYTLLNVR